MEQKSEVKLYVYDLSLGLAPQFSQLLFNKHVNGIWHSTIAIFGMEYYFGSRGIVQCELGTTDMGLPEKIETLGETYVTREAFEGYLQGLKQTSYAIGTYDLLKHNCNTFTNEASQFLVGKGIPEYTLHLPQEIVNSIVGPEYSPLVSMMSEFVTAYRNT